MALVQAILNGILIGGVYVLISTGLTLIFGVMGVVNFAQGEFLMLGMYVAYFAFVMFHIDPMVSAVLAFVLLGSFGVLIEITLVRRILTGPPISQIFLTVGIQIALQNGALALFGSDYRSVAVPYQTSSLYLGPLVIPVTFLFAFLWAAFTSACLYFFLTQTDFGRAMRAVAVNGQASLLCGVPVRRVRTVAFAVGVGLAGLAGAVILPYAYAYPNVGLHYIVIMFTIVVLGGLGNVSGAVAGSMIVGITQSVSTMFLPAALQNIVVFVLFIVVLMIRPSGIFGRASSA